MNACENSNSVKGTMLEMGRRARIAARHLAIASSASKSQAVRCAADSIRDRHAEILAANDRDLENARQNGLSAAMLDRLELSETRIVSMETALREIAQLPDPVGEVIAQFDRPNGLHIERVRTPLGVIGVVFESRPNVTADAGALCLQAGNATILRGGSDSAHSSSVIHRCLVDGLAVAKLPADCIQLVATTDRAAVGEMLTGLAGNLDVLIPRGGRSLVSRVQAESRVPVFSHLEGICHTYIESSAELEMATRVVVNAKMRRTGICGATETILIDRDCLSTHLEPIVIALQDAGCEVRGDAESCGRINTLQPASESDWTTEYLDAIVSIKVVNGMDDAIEHIAAHSSNHTEAILTSDQGLAQRFMNEVDSAIVMQNTSTQFADGGEFGMGAEIGIATGKMHARGPVGVQQLTSFKYKVFGRGQTRPI